MLKNLFAEADPMLVSWAFFRSYERVQASRESMWNSPLLMSNFTSIKVLPKVEFWPPMEAALRLDQIFWPNPRKTQIWKYHSRRLPHKKQCFGLWKNCNNITCRYAKVNDFAKILEVWLENYGLPRPLKFRHILACKSADFRAKDLSFWI